jgi:wobble nucleotide-excising tRNase
VGQNSIGVDTWVNDGSHFAHDDVYVSLDESMVETYLGVFRKIFERSGHLAHYEMMMGDSFAEKKLPTPVKEAAA